MAGSILEDACKKMNVDLQIASFAVAALTASLMGVKFTKDLLAVGRRNFAYYGHSVELLDTGKRVHSHKHAAFVIIAAFVATRIG